MDILEPFLIIVLFVIVAKLVATCTQNVHRSSNTRVPSLNRVQEVLNLLPWDKYDTTIYQQYYIQELVNRAINEPSLVNVNKVGNVLHGLLMTLPNNKQIMLQHSNLSDFIMKAFNKTSTDFHNLGN